MIEINNSSVAEAMSLADTDLPATDVRNAASQQALMDSLVADDESVRPLSDYLENDEQAEAAEQQEAEEDAEPEFDAAALGQQFADQYEHEKLISEAAAYKAAHEQEQNQQEPQQPTPPNVTYQDIDASIRNTDAFVAEHQLVDPVECDLLRANLSTFGASPASSEVLQSSIGRLGISAIQSMEQSNWSFDNVRPLHPLQAIAIHDETCRLLGQDPQQSTVANRQAFGADVMFMVANFMKTVNERGVGASIEQLNDPEWAVEAVTRLNSYHGDSTPVDRGTAVKVINILTRPLLSFARRYAQQAAQYQQPTQQRTTRSARSNRSASKFRTNSDLFDNEALEAYYNARGRL